MAGESSEASKAPAGEEKSTRKRLQRTLTRILSIRRPSKDGKGKSEPAPPAPPAPSKEQPPSTSTPAAPPAPPVQPKTSAPAQVETPAPALPLEPIEQKETQKVVALTKKADRDTIPIRSPDDKKDGPPPILSPAERAQALFRKHGLDITPSEWPFSTRPQGERVHKEIRMRIHRSCHKCDTGYGPEKVCVKCGHRRCKQCPRMPVKKPQDKGKQREGVKPTTKPGTKPGISRPKKPMLTIPNPRGGPDLVRKTIKQRVHRTCHRCKGPFGPDKICTKCNHTRCKKCPRDPRKKSKPPGYYESRDPSDSEKEEFIGRQRRVYRRKRLRVRWVCGQCDSTFLEHNKVCSGCGSSRDEVGIRHPPKRDRNPNTQIPSDSEIERIQLQLQATNL